MTNIQNILRLTWRQVYDLVTVRLPSQDFAEQRRLSWARVIESYAAVPNVYKAFFEPFRADGRAFPYTILTPSFAGFIQRTTEKLICDCGHEIYVLKRSGNALETQCYPLEWITYVEVRTTLLDSRIKISGVTKQGTPASSTLKFNSVTDHLFTPILERIRLAEVDCIDTTRSSEPDNFRQWVKLNYKFMNYARRSLLGGEKVLTAILQPEIRGRALTVLGKTHYRRMSPTHATILTDRELITIREDERPRADASYSGIWDYIPLNKIVGLSVSENANHRLVLAIQLSESARLEQLFQASAKQEIDQLLERYRALTTA